MSDPCSICKGACCESLELPVHLFSHDVVDFLRIRGVEQGVLPTSRIEIESRCPSLTNVGQCACHDTRPKVCKNYDVGGFYCRATVLRRRPENAKAIFEAMKTL